MKGFLFFVLTSALAGGLFGFAGENLVLTKVNPEGDILWSRTYQRPGMDPNFPWCVKSTADSGYVVTVVMDHFEQPKTGWCGTWFLKMNARGDTIWTRDLKNGMLIYCITQTKDGGYIVTGEYEHCEDTFFYHMSYFMLAKLDQKGKPIWEKEFKELGFLKGKWVEQTSDGGYIAGGDCYIIKCDSQGNLLWSYEPSELFDYSLDTTQSTWTTTYCIKETQDKGYIFTGYAAFKDNLMLVKIDSNGGVLWSRVYWGDKSMFKSAGFNVIQTKAGNYVLTGRFNDSLIVISVDKHGKELWRTIHVVGSFNRGGYVVSQAYNGGYVVFGNLYRLFKLDSHGNILWQKDYPLCVPSLTRGRNMDLTLDKNYILVGL